MTSNLDLIANRLGSGQHSVVARSQLLKLGATDPQIQRRLRSGRWETPYPGVYLLGGHPDSPERRITAAGLAVGPHAVISHETAASRHRFTGYPPGPLVFTVPHGGHHHVSGVVVHQITDLTARWTLPWGPLRIAGPARIFVDLAAVSHPARLRVSLADALAAGRVTIEELNVALAAVARPGKPGVTLLGHLLDDYAPGRPISDSVLERELLGIIARHGLSIPEPQVVHPGRDVPDGCVDFAYRAEKLILEADGRRWHGRITDFKRDRVRDQQAARTGWLTLRFHHDQLKYDHAEVAAVIADTLASRRPTAA